MTTSNRFGSGPGHEYVATLGNASMTDDEANELRSHLVSEHDVSEDLASRLSRTGLIFIHVGAHEEDEIV